jgi:hypothetical protein
MYLYGIKCKPIFKKFDKKIREKITNFEMMFLEFFWKFSCFLKNNNIILYIIINI